MNKNITVINENLWVVNFDYIRMGYIKELSLKNADASDYATFTKDGKLILNNKQEYFQDVLQYITILMEFPDQQLGCNEGFYCFIRKLIPKADKLSDQQFMDFIEKNPYDQLQKVFFNFSELEKQRRKIQSDYIKGNKHPLGIDKITGIMRKKGGVNYGKY